MVGGRLDAGPSHFKTSVGMFKPILPGVETAPSVRTIKVIPQAAPSVMAQPSVIVQPSGGVTAVDGVEAKAVIGKTGASVIREEGRKRSAPKKGAGPLRLLKRPSPLKAVAVGAPLESFSRAATEDFALRLGFRTKKVQDVSGVSNAKVLGNGLKRASEVSRGPLNPGIDSALRENRSAGLIPKVSVAAAAAGLAIKVVSELTFGLVGMVLPSLVSAGSLLGTVLTTASGVSMTLVGVAGAAFALTTLSSLGIFKYLMRRGEGKGAQDLNDFLMAETRAGRLDAGIAGRIKMLIPEGKRDLTYGYHHQGLIFLRPELTATPWFFRVVLAHELSHFFSQRARGPPPANKYKRLWSRFIDELKARLAEFNPLKTIRKAKLPLIERAVLGARTSLLYNQPYEVLVVNPTSDEMADPESYRPVSGGQASLVVRETQTPEKLLADEDFAGRFRSVVLNYASQILPSAKNKESLRLERAFERMNELYLVSINAMAAPETFNTQDERRSRVLGGLTKRMAHGDPKAAENFDRMMRQVWAEMSITLGLDKITMVKVVQGLYQSLRNKGLAFLPFAPEDPGVDVMERMLRYWQASDGGRFNLSRVDMPGGSHVLVLRKVEPRVGLWLRPLNDEKIQVSVANAAETPELAQAARKVLAEAGFADQLDLFDKLGVEVHNVFGKDVGRQEIFISAPRKNASVILKTFSGRAVEVEKSRGGFQSHLDSAGERHDVGPVWRVGISGAGGEILWADTGLSIHHEDLDGSVEMISMVGEAIGDPNGHGTHALAIGKSHGTRYRGMAPGSHGVMAGVFGWDTPWASDGPIMGSGIVAVQRGSDVESLSLGVKGNSGDNLSRFFSGLTQVKNAKGEHLIVTASAGNSGPHDRTISQPSAGVNVIAVAADDFYSSVGPDIDPRYGVKRIRLKPDITAWGGTIETLPGDPDPYRKAVTAAKSRLSKPSHSDTENGQHTRKAGTSMSNPALAGIALLVKLALRTTGSLRGYVKDHLPFAVKAILMRTARDRQVPAWFQGAGFVDSWAAVKLVISTALPWFGLKPDKKGGADWDWLKRLKRVQNLEDEVYSGVRLPRKKRPRLETEQGKGATNSADELKFEYVHPGMDSEKMRGFNDAARKAVPALTEALDASKEDVWLVRFNAALVLLNLEDRTSFDALSRAAQEDPDARVRRMAFLALAKLPRLPKNAVLPDSAKQESWESQLYASFVQSQQGRGGVEKLVAGLSHEETEARFTAAWLIGQLSKPKSAYAEALSARVRDTDEDNYVRHLAAASLSNIVKTRPKAISSRVIEDLIEASGKQNLALTRTVSKFFPAALGSPEIAGRLAADPLRGLITDFVFKNKSTYYRPGALGEMVRALADRLGIDVNVPTPVPDPKGLGIPGVDPVLGPVDVLVELPDRSSLAAFVDGRDLAKGRMADEALVRARISPESLSRHRAELKAVLPYSRALWVSVPAHKLYAFTYEMESRGLEVRRSLPKYSVTLGAYGSREAPKNGVRVISFFPETARGGSEARIMADVEAAVARAADPLEDPLLIVLGVGGTGGKDSPLSRLANELIKSDVGVIVPAGNEGPAAGSVSSPANAGLPVVVGAASETGVEVYSSRGTKSDPLITWTERIGAPGMTLGAHEGSTSLAAESAAGKLAELMGAMSSAYGLHGRKLPQGYFLYLVELVKETLTRTAEKPRAGGSGLFEDIERAKELLESRLEALDAATSQAKGLTLRLRGPPESGKSGDVDIFEIVEENAPLARGPPKTSFLKRFLFASWDTWTERLTNATVVLAFTLQLPQFFKNITGLAFQYPFWETIRQGINAAIVSLSSLVSSVPGLSSLFDGLLLSPVTAEAFNAISILPWMGYTTGVLANMLLLGYFVGQKQKAAARVQAVGVVTGAVIMVQIFMAGFMPALAFWTIIPAVTSGLLFTYLRAKGKILPVVWKTWERGAGLLGLSILPLALWSTFTSTIPYVPMALMAAGGIILMLRHRSGKIGKGMKSFWSQLSAWTATLLFMFAPVAGLMNIINNPANIQGIALGTIIMATIGNAMMVPRSVLTKDRIWFAGSAWGLLVQGLAFFAAMWLLGTVSAVFFWGAVAATAVYCAFILLMTKRHHGEKSLIDTLRFLWSSKK